MERAEFNSIALCWDPAQQEFREQVFRDVTLAPMDLGSLYGAIVVERLRTFGGRIAFCEPHWERFRSGCEVLRVDLPLKATSFHHALQQLLERNDAWLASENDLSLVMIATPGNPDYDLGHCTMILHALPIPWSRLARWYQVGTSLVKSEYRTGAGTSFPPSIKVRNRLAYYLADRDAEDKRHGALGLVGTFQGGVGDTSVANLLLIDPNGNWVSPTEDTVLVGTSLRLSERLLLERGTAIHHRRVDWDELSTARELILVGNTGCVWHVSDIDGVPIGDGTRGPACVLLQGLWIEHLQFDWRNQAILKSQQP